MAVGDHPFDVGYCRPPRHTRFKKGQSGNPAGRRKGTRSLQAEFAAELNATITLKEQGRPIKITKLQALVKALYARAIGGDAKAMALLLEMIGRLGLLDPPPSPQNDHVDDGAPEDAAILAALIRRKRGESDDG